MTKQEYISPYQGKTENDWLPITEGLLSRHPLKKEEIAEVVLECWKDIFESGIGAKPFKIGIDIIPGPQIMSFLLHELIALEFERRYPGIWRKDKNKNDKDLVCLVDENYSTEIKASSHPNQVFGNRSYAQPRIGDGKSKNGFYITINFDQPKNTNLGRIRIVRFGWLDHSDWIAQKAATGQQARISAHAYRYKLMELYKI